jgi:hypothetical protein
MSAKERRGPSFETDAKEPSATRRLPMPPTVPPENSHRHGRDTLPEFP